MDRMQITLSEKRLSTFKRVQLPVITKTEEENLSYLYIGRNFRRIHELAEGFDTSCHTNSFNSALEILSRLAKADNLPGIILFDASMPVSELSSFLNTIRQHEEYNNIGVIAEMAYYSENYVTIFRSQKYVDDLVMLTDKTILRSKAAFLVKTKQFEEKMVTSGVETHMKPGKISLIVLRRIFDMLFSSLLIFILTPFLLLIALAIRLESAGPVFSVSFGTGMKYQRFRFIKFRTFYSLSENKMADICQVNQYHGSEDHPMVLHVTETQQTTRIGTFLRSTNLDELPSLFNVLLGDISLLGERIVNTNVKM